MFAFLSWYATITLAGWIAFPIAFRYLKWLPDHGYTAARALGWLAWGYLFWISTSFRLTINNPGGVLLALILLAFLSLLSLGGRERAAELRDWLKKNSRTILAAEMVFLGAFAFWTLIRAMMPEISGTEKPMELAFINGILKSTSFPPHDPWLSGYAISYYYFGYVLIAILAQFTATPAGIAFNLGIALLFGLCSLGAYGIVANLLAWRSNNQAGGEVKTGLYSLPLLGPLFLLLVSNLEGFLEVLHARGLFWQQNFDGTWVSGFWKWLGILELDQPPAQPLSWLPSRPGGVVWWRASRVLADYGYDGSFREVIDEFPFFSYLLGDLHPHVLAMPFALLAASLALNQFLSPQEPGFRLGRLAIPLAPASFLLSAVVLGGMSFLNTWDFPIYIALFCAAVIVSRAVRTGWRWPMVGEFIKLGLALGIGGLLLYAPFYIGFASQAGGILPSLIFYTRGTQYWIMFAPLLIPILAWLIYSLKETHGGISIGKGLRFAILLVGGLWLASYLFAGVISLVDRARTMFLTNQGMPSGEIGRLLIQATLDRISAPGAWVTLIFLIGLAVTGLIIRHKAAVPGQNSPGEQLSPASKNLLFAGEQLSQPDIPSPTHAGKFVLILILLGALLTLVPEYFYLLDQFGGRMNTIFKFYFQTWIVWSLAAAYGTAVLWQSLKGISALITRTILGVTILVSLVYAPIMLSERTGGFSFSRGLSLDGLQSFRDYNPEDAAVIGWLDSAPAGVVAEAVGGQYSSYARIATQTGLPGVLGWPGHESQWRGGDKLFVSRMGDIERLYQTNDWAEAEEIIQLYSIRYIVVSGLERSTYRVNETKFQDHLIPVFVQGNAIVYEVAIQAAAMPSKHQEILSP